MHICRLHHHQNWIYSNCDGWVFSITVINTNGHNLRWALCVLQLRSPTVRCFSSFLADGFLDCDRRRTITFLQPWFALAWSHIQSGKLPIVCPSALWLEWGCAFIGPHLPPEGEHLRCSGGCLGIDQIYTVVKIWVYTVHIILRYKGSIVYI